MSEKKRLAALLALLLILAPGLSACGGAPAETEGESGGTPPPPAAPAEEPPAPAPTVLCPIDGTYVYELPPRPVAITIDNNESAQPQSGLTAADLVCEIPVEGGITRYVAVYYHGTAGRIGPVRSARPYLVDLAREWGAVYVHAGQSPQAQAYFQTERIAHINEMFHPEGFYRDPDRRAPHNLYTSSGELWEQIEALGLDGTVAVDPWPFRPEGTAAAGEPAATVEITYYYGTVGWLYEAGTGRYYRQLDGTPYRDAETREQISAANLLVQTVGFRSFDTVGRLEARLVGEGKGWYFSDGVGQPITWKRAAVTGRTLYLDEAGAPLAMKQGPTWIQYTASSKALRFGDPE